MRCSGPAIDSLLVDIFNSGWSRSTRRSSAEDSMSMHEHHGHDHDCDGHMHEGMREDIKFSERAPARSR